MLIASTYSSSLNTLAYPPTTNLPGKLNSDVNSQQQQPLRNPLPRLPPQNPAVKESEKSGSALAVNNIAGSRESVFSSFSQPIAKPQVVDVKQNQPQTAKSVLSGTTSKDSQIPVAASAGGMPGKSLATSTLELDYNLKKGDENKTNPTPAVSHENLHHVPKNSYEKLLGKLVLKFPQYTQKQLMEFVKEFREQRSGKLSGLSMESIISHVSALIESKRKVSPVLEDKSKNRLNPSAVLVNKKLISNDTKAKKPVENTTQKCPWGKSEGESSKQWSGNNIEDGCIICYEDMSKNPYKADCGHCFHLKCIQEWLSKKSDCPICRVHLLLPDDYPVLK